jgi:chromosome segregation ATPase
MSDAANIQGVTKLAADCELAAKVMAETGTFETGQAILKEAAATLTALSEQNASLAAQVAELTRERDENAQDAYMMGKWQQEKLAAEAKVAELTREREAVNDAIAAKGGTIHTPTQWAYDQACAAIEKHRNRAEAAEAKLARLEAPDAVEALVKAVPPLIVIALDNLDGMNAETREECKRDIEKARAALAAIRAGGKP